MVLKTWSLFLCLRRKLCFQVKSTLTQTYFYSLENPALTVARIPFVEKTEQWEKVQITGLVLSMFSIFCSVFNKVASNRRIKMNTSSPKCPLSVTDPRFLVGARPPSEWRSHWFCHIYFNSHPRRDLEFDCN